MENEEKAAKPRVMEIQQILDRRLLSRMIGGPDEREVALRHTLHALGNVKLPETYKVTITGRAKDPFVRVKMEWPDE